MYGDFFIKGGGGYWEEGGGLCEVWFGYGYWGVDLLNVGFVVFVERFVYVFFVGRIGRMGLGVFEG